MTYESAPFFNPRISQRTRFTAAPLVVHITLCAIFAGPIEKGGRKVTIATIDIKHIVSYIFASV